MRFDIRPVPHDSLAGFTAKPLLKAVELSWQVPTNGTDYKAAQLWVNTVNDRETATLVNTVYDSVYQHTLETTGLRYYWIRAVDSFGRASGLWAGPVSASPLLVQPSDLGFELSAKSLSLQASSQIFQINKADAVAPGTITLDAIVAALSGTPTWTVVTGTATLSNGVSNWQKTLTYPNMGSDTVTIKVTQDGLSDQMTIVKVREGKDGSGVSVYLTNESANVAATSTGSVSSFSGLGGTFKVYNGLTDITGTGITYSVASTTGGLSISIASTGVYTITALSTDTGTATLRAVYNGTTFDKVYTLSKTKQGTQGATGSGSQGPAGSRGTVDIVVSGSWSDSGANAAISNAGYGSPINRDRVTMYTSSSSTTKFYDNGSWITMTAYFSGGVLIDGTLSANKISGGTISGTSININGNFTVSASGSCQMFVPNFSRATATNGDAAGIAPLTCTSSSFFGSGAPAIRLSSAEGAALEIYGGGGAGIVQNAASANFMRTIVAIGDNAYDLGAAPYNRWRQIYTVNAPIVSSDERTKTDVRPTALGLAFINDLVPVSFKLKVASQEVTDIPVEPTEENPHPAPEHVVTQVAGKRDHYGLLAQQVKATLDAHGASNASIWSQADPDDADSLQALRYEELIGPIIKAVQELSTKLDAVTAELDLLKAQNTASQ